MKILVIDGQGGKMGAAIIEGIKSALPDHHVTAVGTNSAATAAMLRAGADAAATGENPVRVCSVGADVIVGPIGIVLADALHGEITPNMARHVACSRAQKLLIPTARCGTRVVGTHDAPLGDYVRMAIEQIRELSAQPGT